FAAKILEKFAKERLKRVEVKIEKITKNPSSYDEMSKFFEEFVKSSYKELKLNAEN
ncbi:hypothetical protein H5U35_01735, partial [Candidatus Aerophobetes bacterium]|nr:hypothetical protein [Candidatus Aerophobetes bacterium]